MIRRILTIVTFLLAFLAAHAAAQPEAPNRVAVVQDVADRCPGLVLQDHAFTDAVASVLNAQDNRWGRNGKRGNVNDPSHDALAFRNPNSRAGGVSVIDIIVGAGGQFATPGWQDQTQATIDAGTIGAWVAPSGRLPACLSDGTPHPVIPPPPSPIVTPIPSDVAASLKEMTVTLARMDARLAAIEARQPATPDLGLLNMYIDAMIGNGPGGGGENHITDVKQRLDVIRVHLEQLAAWLRSRRALGF